MAPADQGWPDGGSSPRGRSSMMDTRMLCSRFGLVRRAVVARGLSALLLAALSVPTLSAAAAGCGGCNDDADGLTNYEEYALYGTDLQNPDTDFDGIMDGNEVYA